jgi:hypothetical protein
VAALVAPLVLAFSSLAAAQPPPGWDSLVIRSGALVADLGSDLQVNGTNGRVATTIDLEDDLGFASTTTRFFLEGEWRITRKNQLRVSYVNIDRDVTSAPLRRTITFRDSTFDVGAQVQSFFDTWYIAADTATPSCRIRRSKWGSPSG